MAPRHPVSQVPEALSGAIGPSFEPGPVIAMNRERSLGRPTISEHANRKYPSEMLDSSVL